MNFFGHTVLAVKRSTEPAFVLGSMLPKNPVPELSSHRRPR